MQKTLAFMIFALFSFSAYAQPAGTAYPSMAPLDQYLMPESSEVALARTAAPKSISDAAETMVLTPHGYKTADKGTNGYVCIVFRSWTAPIDDPVFWNPKLRAPICFNPAAARTYLPIMLLRTELILAGKSKAEAFQTVTSALDNKQLPPLEPGAMCYMLSKQQYLSDSGKNWHPHLMFFVPPDDAKSLGANLSGSPIITADDPQDRLTIFLIPVTSWSDGTPAPQFKQ